MRQPQPGGAPCTLRSRKKGKSLEPQGTPRGSCKAVRVLLEGWTGRWSPEPGDVSAKGPGRRGQGRGHGGVQGPCGAQAGWGDPELELVLATEG